MKEARAALGGVAPGGIDALEAERAALGQPEADAAATGEVVPDRATAERAVEAAQRTAEGTVAHARQTTEAAQAAKVAHAKAAAQLEAAESKLGEAEDALAGVDLAAETRARAAAVPSGTEHGTIGVTSWSPGALCAPPLLPEPLFSWACWSFAPGPTAGAIYLDPIATASGKMLIIS